MINADRHPGIVVFPVVLLAIFSGLLFAGDQQLWPDELTQIVGISLDLPAMLMWLITHSPPLDVPYAQLPPLSFFACKGWAWLFGSDPYTMRILSLVCVVTATTVVSSGLARHVGFRAAAVGGLLMALAPQVTVASVEIGVQPQLLLVSSVALMLMLEIMAREWAGGRLLMALIVCLLAATYLHLHGMVLTAMVAVSLLVHFWDDRYSRRRIVAAVALVYILSLFAHAFNLPTSSGAIFRPSWEQVSVELVEQLKLAFIHKTVLHFPIATLLLTVSAVLLLVGCWAARHRLGYRARGPAVALLVAMPLMAVTLWYWRDLGPGKLMRDMLWLLPFAVVLLAMPVCYGRWRWVPSVMIVAVNLLGAVRLAEHGRLYSHGQFEEVAAMVTELPDNSAVVYGGDIEGAGMACLVVHHVADREVPQFFENDDGHLLNLSTLELTPKEVLQQYQTILQVSAGEGVDSAETGWQLSSRERLPGNVSLVVLELRRVGFPKLR